MAVMRALSNEVELFFSGRVAQLLQLCIALIKQVENLPKLTGNLLK